MSHFTTVATQITDEPSLVKALGDLGFKQVEIHETAENLYGYRGDQRSQTAEIIIRRNYIGTASNDVGFKRQPDGTFQAIISQYDRSRFSKNWLDQLSQRYAYHLAVGKLEEQGFALIAEEKQADGRIHLVARRVS